MWPLQTQDCEKVYFTETKADIFELRGLDRSGVVIVVRPDQYVTNVLTRTATDESNTFFAATRPSLQPEAALPGLRKSGTALV